tara:strand:+ start:141 stop:1079 length:939 start_codon:yes stop_codon:yes gene_type:complete
MSNILIIKLGSLGDIVQISGVLRDIKETHKDKRIFILTTMPYIELLSRCPYLDGVLLDKRLPRWNIYYLLRLKKMLNKYNFSHVYDLQNSSRTSFYRKYLVNTSKWNSAETIIKNDEKKTDIKKNSVLMRFKLQLERFNTNTNYCLKPDFNWAAINVDNIVNKFFGKKFIILLPFCSPKLIHKKWPYYNELVSIIRSKHKNLEIAVAPGPDEINEAKKINAISITKNNKALNIMELTGLILKSSFVIANDTGPAHISAHTGKPGIALFGHHTTPDKVSIETDKFKALSVRNLKDLSPNEVYLKIKEKLDLIN